jgi:hypothetical protein
MHAIRRDSIPPRSSAPIPAPLLSRVGDRRNNRDYAGFLSRFLKSDAMVWEIEYNTTTHHAYGIAASFTQARNREKLADAVTVAVRGPRVFLARPGWESATPREKRILDTTTRAETRRTIESALITFAESGADRAIVTIPGDQTALYHALHYQRGRLELSVKVSRGADGIVLTPRG